MRHTKNVISIFKHTVDSQYRRLQLTQTL